MDENILETSEMIKKQIQALFDRRIDDLLGLWKATFEEDVCDSHLRALVGHAEQFLDEVYDECKSRQINIIQRIQELRHEANELKRLLQVDIELNPPDGAPVYSIQSYLDHSLNEMREQLEIRKNHVFAYQKEQQELTEILGEALRPLTDDPLPCEAEMQDFRRYLDDLKMEKDRRLNVIQQLREEIIIFLKDLGIQLDSEEEKALVYAPKLQPTKQNVNQLQKLKGFLSQQFEEMKLEIDKYRNKLDQLWTFLQISPKTTEKFLQCAAYTEDTYVKLFAEYNRCEAIKRENIEKYVQKIRCEVLHMWDMCYKSQEERDRFTPFNSEIYNEDLLSLHEMELAELKAFYDQNKDVFELFQARKELWEQMHAIDQRANDKNRFNNRGGQLLKEERERKKINSRIPKVEEQLLELCEKYFEREHKEILIEGRSIRDIIEEDHMKREEEKQTRKKVVSAASTPMNGSKYVFGRTPQTGSALKNLTRNNIMSANKTASTTKMLGSTVRSNMKRRLSPCSTSKVLPMAKRNLLPQMNTSSFLRPTPVSLKANPVSAKGLKRRSIKRQSIKSKRRLSKKRYRNCGGDVVIECETSTHSESISYDLFENYVTTNTPMRSSVLISPTTRTVSGTKPLKSSTKVPTITVSRANSHYARSPSPNVGSEKKRFTTKNIPFMF